VRSNEKRGDAGLAYGDDAAAAWLARHGLVRLVRSHEECPRGHDARALPPAPAAAAAARPARRRRPRWLHTVFSTSNYPHGDGVNDAAVLVLRFGGAAGRAAGAEPAEGDDDDDDDRGEGEGEGGEDEDGEADVYRWSVDDDDPTAGSGAAAAEDAARGSLVGLIAARAPELRAAFREVPFGMTPHDRLT